MFLNKIRNIFCVSATNVVHVGKQGNFCVGNNVSSFARALNLSNLLTTQQTFADKSLKVYKQDVMARLLTNIHVLYM